MLWPIELWPRRSSGPRGWARQEQHRSAAQGVAFANARAPRACRPTNGDRSNRRTGTAVLLPGHHLSISRHVSAGMQNAPPAVLRRWGDRSCVAPSWPGGSRSHGALSLGRPAPICALLSFVSERRASSAEAGSARWLLPSREPVVFTGSAAMASGCSIIVNGHEAVTASGRRGAPADGRQ